MPNPLQVSNMFAGMMPDPRVERQNMLSDVQGLEALRGIKNQNMLSQILAENPGNYDAAAEAFLSQGGDAKTALGLRDMAHREEERLYQKDQRALAGEDRARKTEIEKLGLMGDFEKMMADVPTLTPQTYSAWAKRARRIAEMAGESPDEIPAEYDEAFVMEARAAMKAASRPSVEQIDGRDALYDPSKGTWSLSKNTDRVTWGMLPPEQAKAMGLPEGGTYRVNSDGKVEPITRPPTETNPAKVQIMDVLMQRGIASTPQEAWSMANQAVQNPQTAAGAMARADFNAQQKAIENGAMDQSAARPLETMYNEWLGIISSQSQPTGQGTLEDPIAVTSPEQVRSLPPGTYVRKPDGTLGRVPAR